MKRICSLLLSVCLIFSICSCGQRAANTSTWQEQYDLGIRYLSEGNYEEAIIAFEAAIKIDPKQADAYIGLADVYTAQGNISMALQILNQGKEAVGETDALLQAIENARIVRRDLSDGEWVINEYDENGNQTLSTWYMADGSVKSISEYTYDGETYTISTQKYHAPGNEVYEIEIYDANYDRMIERTWVSKPIPIDAHHSGSEDHIKYHYHGTQVTVTYDAYSWTVNGKESDGSDTVVYEMAAPENYLRVSWSHSSDPDDTKIIGLSEYSPAHDLVNEVEY